MSLDDGQISYGGVTVGCETDFDLTTVEGLDGFDVRTNDEILPSLWGVVGGAEFVNGRVVTLGVAMLTSLAEWSTVQNAFLPPPQTVPTRLSPLVWKFADTPELMCNARVQRRGRARTGDSEAPGGLVQWVYELFAPDPRAYSNVESGVSGGPFTPDSEGLELSAGSGAGAAFDLTVSSGADAAFDFGGTAGGGTLTATNNGNTDTYPTFTFSTVSTVDAWTVYNDTTGESASFTVALDSSDQLVVNMAAMATGIIAPVVTLNGTPLFSAWQTPRVPIRLVPGANSLRFIIDSGPTDDPGIEITWRDAYV